MIQIAKAANVSLQTFYKYEDIFSNDSTGLLDDIKPATKSADNNSVLTQQFDTINLFIDQYGIP